MTILSNLVTLNDQTQAALERARGWQLKKYFKDIGEFSRDKYPKHIAFFDAGATYRERLMLAANRVGKTESVGLYEIVMHALGRYPKWWRGRRCEQPVKVWICGDTKQTVREILQEKLLGPLSDVGTGVLPRESIYRIVKGVGVADSVEIVYVKHKNGLSQLTFKSYDQGRKAFQGTEQDIILLDEEPPLAVYTECLLLPLS